MPTVTMPQLGEAEEEGTIGKWLKNVGDHVAVGEPLVEVITDKVNAEVPSPVEGTLSKIIAQEGDVVGADALLAEVDAVGTADAPSAANAAPSTNAAPTTSESATAAEAAATAEAVSTQSTLPAAPPPPAPSAATAEVAARSAPAAGSNGSGSNGVPTAAVATATLVPVKARMTPAVRRLAREHQVDLGAVTGSGIGGRITRDDVQRAVDGGAAGSATTTPTSSAAVPVSAAPSKALPSPVADGDSLKKLSPMRKAIAKQMTRSLDTPTAYIMVEVDMTNVVRRRTKLNAEYKAREGMSLSYVAFMTKACVEALRKHSDINAHWTDEGHWRRKAINVGIAVAVDDGLVVPVIKDADSLSLHGLNAAINDLAARSRSKKVLPDEMRGGTFTVDNTGWTGSILTLPIINVPEVAIITMEKVVKRPVVIEGAGGDAIAVRQMMNMCIAIDHRATDGAQAGEFLKDVREWLEAVDDNTPIW